MESISSFSARGLRIAQFALFYPGIDRIKTRPFDRLAREYSPECFLSVRRSQYSAYRRREAALGLCNTLQGRKYRPVDAQGSLSAQLVDSAGDYGFARPESVSGEERGGRK